MKRTIAWVAALLLALTLLPAYNSAKADITPLSIAINTKATKRVYAVGEALDLTGLVLDYYNGLVQDPTPVTYLASYVASNPAAGKFMTSTANGYVFTSDDVGEKTITVTYNSGVTVDSVVQKPTTTFTVTVVAADVSYPTGFTILTEPANTS